MDITIRPYRMDDLEAMLTIWNDVVEEGTEFPQMDLLNEQSGPQFFDAQTLTAVAERNGSILGLYILHPNNVGRCGHICNASFAVRRTARGMHLGEAMVRDCLEQAKGLGFKVLQFNAVVENNVAAIKLYEKMGFTRIGKVPGGFLLKDGSFADIVLFYHKL